jgi:uncharacterized integral membrane protein (TIGR00698 family)
MAIGVSMAALQAKGVSFRALGPGLGVAVIIALAAQFVSDHYGAPVMLMALLFGMVLNFLGEDGPCRAGVNAAAGTLLRLGVALLGFRVSLGLLVDLGWPVAILVVVAVAVTILVGVALAPAFGHGWRFGLLSGGAVAICGASAAVAIAAILPRDERSEERLVFTVAAVTLMSTVAMILYPILLKTFGLSDGAAAIFLGASIHDVAQVVGAGFSVSPEVGETATAVKLMRVALLAPVLIIVAIVIRTFAGAASTGQGARRPPLLPWFVLAFLAASTASSIGYVPEPVIEVTGTLSRWALVIAIAGVGLKTSLARIMQVGRGAALLVIVETMVLGGLVITVVGFLAP